jgi:hypothetical protein
MSRDSLPYVLPALELSDTASACRGGEGTPSLQGQLFATISIYDLNIVLRIKNPEYTRLDQLWDPLL